MQHLSSLAARVAFVSRVVALLGLLLALLLPGPAARAQAPTFALATSGNNFQPTTGTSFTGSHNSRNGKQR